MPLFDYLCPECEKVSRDTLVHSPIPDTLPCECGATAKRLIGLPCVRTELATMTEAKDIWEGFGPGLEDSDGINQTHYKSNKAYFA